jgi:hypothetical protein
VTPYRTPAARPLPAVAPRAPWWARARAEYRDGLSNRLRARQARLLLLALARTAPSDFARLMHGHPFESHDLNESARHDESGMCPAEVRPPAISAAQAIRALRGCSAEERDRVAQHLHGCAHCLAALAGEEWSVTPEHHGERGASGQPRGLRFTRVADRGGSAPAALVGMGSGALSALLGAVRGARDRAT